MSKKYSPSLPQWSWRIVEIRTSQGLSQSALGHGLGVSAMTVSRWERGLCEPQADHYISLGRMADASLCWFFWNRAGLQRSDVMEASPRAGKSRNTEVAIAGIKPQSSTRKKHKFITVPLLPVEAGTSETGGQPADIDAVQAEDFMTAPAAWCPHPESTICLRVKGNSMSPLILDGYVIAVDRANSKSEDLIGQIVVASHLDKGLLVSRLIRFGRANALISDHREYQSVPVNATSEWRIIGKVLWWIGQAR